MIWFLMAVLAVLAAGIVFRAGADEGGDDASVAARLAPYRERLAALDAARDAAELDEADYRQARLEVERQILRLARTSAGGQEAARGRPATRSGQALPAVMAIAVAAAAGGLYGLWGSPQIASILPERISRADAPISEDGTSFADAIAIIEQRLAAVPDDIQGWQVLGRTSAGLGDFQRAANAFQRLSALEPDNPLWMAQWLEAVRAMGEGRMTPAARLINERLQVRFPDHPSGPYYKGLAALQDGEEEVARTLWQGLLDSDTEGTGWRPRVVAALEQLGGTPAPAPSPASGDNTGPIRPPGIDAATAEAVQAMTPEDQAAFIAGMMARLAARLEENPGDAGGWLMLARSQAAQGKLAEARATLQSGLAKVAPADQPSLQAALDKLPAP